MAKLKKDIGYTTTIGLRKKLEELIEYKKDKKISKTKQAAEMDINYQTLCNYTNENKRTQCSVENLYKIAKYYNVSADYLIGLSEEKSNKLKNQTIYRKTGLTTESVKGIRVLYDYQEKFSNHPLLRYLNNFISSKRLVSLFQDISEAIDAKRNYDNYKNDSEKRAHDEQTMNVEEIDKDLYDEFKQKKYYINLTINSIIDEIIDNYTIPQKRKEPKEQKEQ